jgi:Zn finger protein HypA/HybF involved in hydrogenase expression
MRSPLFINPYTKHLHRKSKKIKKQLDMDRIKVYCPQCDTICVVMMEEHNEVLYCPFCSNEEIELIVDDGYEIETEW